MLYRRTVLWALSLFALLLAAPLASAQSGTAVQNRLQRYGRMPRPEAAELAQAVNTRMMDNARRGGAGYDSLRQAFGRAMFDGPGQTRAEYDERLAGVLSRLAQGLTDENLDALASGDLSALTCTEQLGITMGQCDALLAAAARQMADVPYTAPDDGALLSAELVEAGVSPELSSEIVRALSATMLSVPGSADQSERGRQLDRLITSCPGTLPDRESRVRSWHLGPNSALARCFGLTIGRSRDGSAARLAHGVLGLPNDAAVPFLRWAHRQPVREEARRGPSPSELMRRAMEHYRAGRFADAARAYEAVIGLEPTSAPAHQGLAVSRLRAGDAAGAAEAYRATARLLPRSAEVQIGLARASSRAGDREGAIAAYRAALSLAPGNQSATRELAGLLSSRPVMSAAPATTHGGV